MGTLLDNKVRLLVVYRMVLENDYVTVAKIQERLEKRYDIHADRKTIMDDLHAIDKILPLESRAVRNGGYRKYTSFEEEIPWRNISEI
jgi:hypothetical protein